MSDGDNKRINTPCGPHGSGNSTTASAVAGARILKAPTQLTDEHSVRQISFRQKMKTLSGRLANVPGQLDAQRPISVYWPSPQDSVALPENMKPPESGK